MSEPRQPTDERTHPDRAWVVEVWSKSGWWLPTGAAPSYEGALEVLGRLSTSDPTCAFKVEQYMRVLSRPEVEKLASDEGVDVQQLLNSYRRTIEGQRREISRLNEALRRKASDEAPSFSPNFDERNGIR